MNNPLTVHERRFIALLSVLFFVCLLLVGMEYKSHEQFCFETAQKMLDNFQCTGDPVKTEAVLQRIHSLAVGSGRYYDLKFEGKPISQQVFYDLEKRCGP